MLGDRKVDNMFVSINLFETVSQTDNGSQILLWESRITSDGYRLLFTRIDGIDVRVNSIYDFMLQRPSYSPLEIRHSVSLLWNALSIQAVLVEILILDINDKLAPIHTKLRLETFDKIYATDDAISLTEAIWELHELVGEEADWSLQTCHECIYGWPAFRGPISDRDELRCFRDSPDAFAEREIKRKFASEAAFQAGDYFVNAFHTCAAWSRSSELK